MNVDARPAAVTSSAVSPADQEPLASNSQPKQQFIARCAATRHARIRCGPFLIYPPVAGMVGPTPRDRQVLHGVDPDGRRLRPRRSSFQTTSTSPSVRARRQAVETRPVVTEAGGGVVVERLTRVVDAGRPQGISRCRSSDWAGAAGDCPRSESRCARSPSTVTVSAVRVVELRRSSLERAVVRPGSRAATDRCSCARASSAPAPRSGRARPTPPSGRFDSFALMASAGTFEPEPGQPGGACWSSATKRARLSSSTRNAPSPGRGKVLWFADELGPRGSS